MSNCIVGCLWISAASGFLMVFRFAAGFPAECLSIMALRHTLIPEAQKRLQKITGCLIKLGFSAFTTMLFWQPAPKGLDEYFSHVRRNRHF